MKKTRVAAVSYLNTKPLLYGIKHHAVMNEIELVEEYPARIAQMLIEDKVDVGLIPIAATTRLPQWEIISDYCIGAEGAVGSVCIFSEVPLEEVENVLLDYQSRTSVNLAKILLREFWQKDVQFIDATGEDYRQQINSTTAGVVIGDRALQQRQKSKYIYDLAEAWLQHTGLPFVFAAWIANKPVTAAFRSAFNEANAVGLLHLDEVIAENQIDYFDLHKYYTRCISYQLDEAKRQGMNLFLEKLKQIH